MKHKRILPKDTEITKYFLYKNEVFAKKYLPDGRILLQIVHTWCDDGEIMNFGFDFGEGGQTGLNPLHIVKIFDKEPSRSSLQRALKKFYAMYYLEETTDSILLYTY